MNPKNQYSRKSTMLPVHVRLSKEDGDIVSANKRESNSISNQKVLT